MSYKINHVPPSEKTGQKEWEVIDEDMKIEGELLLIGCYETQEQAQAAINDIEMEEVVVAEFNGWLEETSDQVGWDRANILQIIKDYF